jgi:hypothetical protein
MAKTFCACIAWMSAAFSVLGASGEFAPTPAIVINSRALVAESIAADSIIESNEVVTFSITLTNAGDYFCPTTSVYIVETNGIVPIAASYEFGTMLVGETETRDFTFRVEGPPGRIIQVIMMVMRGGEEISRNVFDVGIGRTTAGGANFRSMKIPWDEDGENAPASYYPSPITLSNVVGSISSVRVTLHNFAHMFPEDVNVVLVSPAGSMLMLMSDVGGPFQTFNANLTFSSGLTNLLPTMASVVSGTYAATDYNTPNYLPEPGPTNVPYGGKLEGFNKQNPNGTWKLYVSDIRMFDYGFMFGGWSLSVGTLHPPFLTVTNNGDGRVRITLNGTGNRNFLIDYSTNMTTWTTMGQTPSGVQNPIFYDTLPTNGQKFYRARRLSE